MNIFQSILEDENAQVQERGPKAGGDEDVDAAERDEEEEAAAGHGPFEQGRTTHPFIHPYKCISITHFNKATTHPYYPLHRGVSVHQMY